MEYTLPNTSSTLLLVPGRHLIETRGWRDVTTTYGGTVITRHPELLPHGPMRAEFVAAEGLKYNFENIIRDYIISGTNKFVGGAMWIGVSERGRVISTAVLDAGQSVSSHTWNFRTYEEYLYPSEMQVPPGQLASLDVPKDVVQLTEVVGKSDSGWEIVFHPSPGAKILKVIPGTYSMCII